MMPGYDLGSTIFWVLAVAGGLIAIVLAVMWTFLPWLLLAKMDRIIALLEVLAGKAK